MIQFSLESFLCIASKCNQNISCSIAIYLLTHLTTDFPQESSLYMLNFLNYQSGKFIGPAFLRHISCTTLFFHYICKIRWERSNSLVSHSFLLRSLLYFPLNTVDRSYWFFCQYTEIVLLCFIRHVNLETRMCRDLNNGIYTLNLSILEILQINVNLIKLWSKQKYLYNNIFLLLRNVCFSKMLIIHISLRYERLVTIIDNMVSHEINNFWLA